MKRLLNSVKIATAMGLLLVQPVMAQQLNVIVTWNTFSQGGEQGLELCLLDNADLCLQFSDAYADCTPPFSGANMLQLWGVNRELELYDNNNRLRAVAFHCDSGRPFSGDFVDLPEVFTMCVGYSSNTPANYFEACFTPYFDRSQIY